MNRSEIAKELGKRGGATTLKKYGTEYFRRIIKLRWARKKGLVPEETADPLDKQKEAVV